MSKCFIWRLLNSFSIKKYSRKYLFVLLSIIVSPVFSQVPEELTENDFPIVDPGFSNVFMEVFRHPSLWVGLIVIWFIFIFASYLSFIAHKKIAKESVFSKWYTTPKGWVIPVLAFGVVLRLTLFSDIPYGFMDEPYYFQAILTGLSTGMPDYLPNMTGSMFLWPPVIYSLGSFGEYVGLPLMFLPRLATVLFSAGSLFCMSKIAEILAERWGREYGFSEKVLAWLPLFSVLLPMFSWNFIFDSVFASYSPMSEFLFAFALYNLVQGIQKNQAAFLLSAAAFIFLGFFTRFFVGIVCLPFFLTLAIYLSWRQENLKRVLVWFALPLFTLLISFFLYMGEKVVSPIQRGRRVSEEVLVFFHIDRSEIIAGILSGVGLIVLFALLGALVMSLTKPQVREKQGWVNRLEALVWLGMGFSAVGYHFVLGHVFTFDKNIALSAIFGLPLAVLGAAMLLNTILRCELWIKVTSGVAGFVLLSFVGWNAFEKTQTLRYLAFSDTQRVIEWFKSDVHLPETGLFRLTNAGPPSNPWSTKVLHQYFNQQMMVSAESAFSQNLLQQMEGKPDFIHSAYRNLDGVPLIKGESHELFKRYFDIPFADAMSPFSQEEWSEIESNRYEVYRIPSIGNFYINYVLVLQGKGISITNNMGAEKLKPVVF